MSTYTLQPLSRLHLLLAIAAAERDGFSHYAQALKTMYVRLHGIK